VMSVVLFPAVFGARFLTIAFYFLILAVFAVFTVGTVLSSNVYDIVQAIAPETTYTGRMTLWEFSIGLIQQHPISGYGLESLWGKPAVMDMERPFDSAWDIRGIVHGHNSYLDSMLDLGIPGALVLFLVIIVLPAVDYLRARRLRANILAADFFMMIIIFTALNAFMETFFFRRGDPVWMLMVVAIVGLRLMATTPFSRGNA
jgi:O-antigen ligase